MRSKKFAWIAQRVVTAQILKEIGTDIGEVKENCLDSTAGCHRANLERDRHGYRWSQRQLLV